MSKSPQQQKLSDRLASLEREVSRLADSMERLATAPPRATPAARPGWRPSLRWYLGLLVVLAAIAAWFGVEFRGSQRQATAVDTLVSERVKLDFEPNESLLVSLLPGSPDNPPPALLRMLGHDFFHRISDVVVDGRIRNDTDPHVVLSAISRLPSLRALQVKNFPLSTKDLSPVFAFRQLESLNVSRTTLDSGSIRDVAWTRLRWLDASHTWLGDLAVSELSRCKHLQYLNLERTAITDQSVEYLAKLTNLREINLNRTQITPSGVTELADKLPDCYIQYQPLVLFEDGSVNVQACYRGRLTFGSESPPDPREFEAARPPGRYTRSNPFAVF